MHPSSQEPPSILSAARQFWGDQAAYNGSLHATRTLLRAVWEFVRDSTPSRLRQRFGDADYDWDYRVNTTSGAVGWRDRLVGTFHSLYQPTEPAAFHEMLDALQRRANLHFADFTFVDLGSGKGRTLLMASDYPFQRIIGVEFLPSLHRIAEQNLTEYKSDAQKCFMVESILEDATTFPLPDAPLIVYLFNPFPESGMRRTVENLATSRDRNPRPIYVLYHNPQLEHVFLENGRFEKMCGTPQYSIFSSIG
jgi:hypothetical protein